VNGTLQQHSTLITRCRGRGVSRPEQERQTRPLRRPAPACRGARRGLAGADDAGGKGRHAVHQRRRRQRRCLAGAEAGDARAGRARRRDADDRTADESFQSLADSRRADRRHVAQPLAALCRTDAAGHSRHHCVRPAQPLQHNIFAMAATDFSQWCETLGFAAIGDAELVRDSPTLCAANTWPSASAWRCTRRSTWQPNRAGRASAAASARTRT
jgi:hypothetical protein